MKKLLVFIIAMMLVLPVIAETVETFEWTREGTFIDDQQNMLSVMASYDESKPGWYVGCMLGDNMYGSIIQQEGDTLHGNIVPEYASCEFYIRAEDSKYCLEFSERVKNCARAAALATGAELKITNFEGFYDNLATNETLSKRAIQHTHEFGITDELAKRENTGSSDIGNVSYRCPCIHQWFDVVGDPNVALHTPELCAGADSDYGYDNMFTIAKAFVATGEDVLTDSEFLAEIRAEFDKLERGERK